MNKSTLVIDIRDRVATVTLNRPERRNALDDVVIRELTEAFSSLQRSSDCRVIILTGSGSSFCAGMDLDYLKRFSALGQQENLDDARNLMKLLQLIAHVRKPVIAKVNGPALGGGCGLAAACDFVYASGSSARFGAPEVKLGFLPALILVYLVRRMGEGRAREFVLKGEIIDPVKARERGLASEVVDDASLDAAVSELALSLANGTSASSVSLTKELFARLHEMSEDETHEYAANLNALTRKTEDFQRGLEAFLKKERIQW